MNADQTDLSPSPLAKDFTDILMICVGTTDYSLNNPDTLTKYKTAGQISEKVLAEVAKLCVPGAKIVDICQKGDKILEDEISKVYRGKKVTKGLEPS